jgi:hypothetical protein
MPFLNLATLHQDDWFYPKKTHRIFGAIGALCLTCFFFLQFQIGLKNNLHTNTYTKTAGFIDLTWVPVFIPQVLLETPPKAKIKPTKASKNIIQDVLVKENSPTLTNIPSIRIQSETGTEVTSLKQTSESKSSAESTLTFDSKSIRRAYQDSKTDIQKMAESSGKPLIKTPYTSKYDEFQSAASRAAKKDCLSANSGGSLLSLIVIPVMAAMDKCKLP